MERLGGAETVKGMGIERPGRGLKGGEK